MPQKATVSGLPAGTISWGLRVLVIAAAYGVEKGAASDIVVLEVLWLITTQRAIVAMQAGLSCITRDNLLSLIVNATLVVRHRVYEGGLTGTCNRAVPQHERRECWAP